MAAYIVNQRSYKGIFTPRISANEDVRARIDNFRVSRAGKLTDRLSRSVDALTVKESTPSKQDAMNSMGLVLADIKMAKEALMMSEMARQLSAKSEMIKRTLSARFNQITEKIKAFAEQEKKNQKAQKASSHPAAAALIKQLKFKSELKHRKLETLETSSKTSPNLKR